MTSCEPFLGHSYVLENPKFDSSIQLEIPPPMVLGEGVGNVRSVAATIEDARQAIEERRQRIVEDVEKSVESQDAAWLHDRMKTCAGDEGFDEAPVCNRCGMPARYHKSEAFLQGFVAGLTKALKESL
jgi:hypothetical protein